MLGACEVVDLAVDGAAFAVEVADLVVDVAVFSAVAAGALAAEAAVFAGAPPDAGAFAGVLAGVLVAGFAGVLPAAFCGVLAGVLAAGAAFCFASLSTIEIFCMLSVEWLDSIPYARYKPNCRDCNNSNLLRLWCIELSAPSPTEGSMSRSKLLLVPTPRYTFRQ